MSTKIYNAYKLTADADVFSFRHDLREVVAPHIYKTAVNERIAYAVYGWDNQVAFGKDVTFRAVLSEELHRYDKTRRETLFDDPLANANAVVMRNAVRGELYVMCFGAVASEAERLLTLPSVACDFSYWNNSDEPDGVTPEEWEDRAKAWDEAMDAGDNEPPIVQGVTIELFSDFDRYLYVDKIQRRATELATPTIEKRANRLGMNLFLSKYSDSLADKNDFTATVMGKMNDWIEGRMDAADKQLFLDRATEVVSGQPTINLAAI